MPICKPATDITLQSIPDQLTTGRVAKFSKLAEILAALFAVAVIVYLLVMIVIGLNKGFDFLDESFYLLVDANPTSYKLITSFGYFLHALPSLALSPSHVLCRLVSLRIWHVIVQVISAIVLSAAVSLWWSRAQQQSFARVALVLIPFSLLGNLHVFGTFPRVLSYNSLASFFAYASFSCLLIAGVFSRRKNLFVFFSGLFLAPLLFVKFTAFFFSGILLLIFLLATRAGGKAFMTFSVGTACGAVLHFAFLENFQSWIAGLSATADVIGQGPHSLTFLWRQYKQSAIDTALELRWFLLPACLFCLALSKRMSQQFRTALIAAGMLALCVLCSHYPGFSINSPVPFWGLMLTLGLCASVLLWQKRQDMQSLTNEFALLSVLSALPIACSLGTGNPLFFHARIYFGAVFIFLGLCCMLIEKHASTRTPLIITSLLLASLSVSQIPDFYIKMPYGLRSDLNQQVLPAKQALLKGVYIDKAT